MYFIANWKMYGSLSSLNSLNKVIKFSKINKNNKFKLIYCPPYTLLNLFSKKIKNSYIELGAQPYEIGAIFIEGAFHYGIGSSEDNLRYTFNDTLSPLQVTESYGYSVSIIKAKVGFSWYLSDFISHNWFTGAVLSLEPSLSYNWKIKNEFSEDMIQKYRGFRFELALISYF